ncbi:MAG TPA: hypothetical protein VFW65_36875 [Pseudonocardiaceae bacterium]|nr:hypothetical protein [Pseudonocardiaceae bacterium]
MISSVGVVPPIVLPLPIEYDSVGQVTTVSEAADPTAVEVAVQPGILQTVPDSPPLTLDTVVAPHAASVSYLPAGGFLVEETWPAVVGPFAQDAWVINAFGDTSVIAPLLPASVPAPVYWVLEGMAPSSVADQLDQWLAGAAAGVHPQADACHRKAPPDRQLDTADHTWKQEMLAGRWAERVPAETVLGLAAPDGTVSRLRIWMFGADGTALPAAGILDAFATVDPELLPTHPVVTGCHALLGDLPVRFYLRFDVWDVTLSSAQDTKGAARSLEPDIVRLADATSGTDIPGTTWTWLSPALGGILEVPRPNVAGATFALRAEFPAGQQIRLSRTNSQTFPVTDRLVWHGVGWTAQDGVTPDHWSAFDGLVIGTQTQPAAFWVGTRVRITAGYQQRRRDWFIQRTYWKLDTRRVAGGHVFNVFQGGTTPVDTFVTDDDGDISGVSFAIVPGPMTTVALPRQLDLPSVNGGNATTMVALSTAFADDQFHGADAITPVVFPAFTSGSIGPAQLVIETRRSGRRHTPDAAAFHALKYTKFTHDATTLLKTDTRNLPQRHEIVIAPHSSDIPDTKAWLAGNPLGTTGPARTETTLGSEKGWFYPNVVIHEYAHALVAWLSTELPNVAQYVPINNAGTTMKDRLDHEFTHGHNAWVVTNSGTAIDEGLPEFFECLLGYRDSFLHRIGTLREGTTVEVPKGQESWQKYLYEVSDPTPAYVQLSKDMGRRVEGVVAMALCQYIMDATDFGGFTVELDDTETGSRPAHAYLDAYAALPGSRPAQLQGLFRWLITGAITGFYTSPTFGWKGAWPIKTPGPPYPTAYNYLLQLQASDPAKSGGAPTPEESFQHLFDTCLVPWNLEPFDPAEPKPPVLDLDWLP